MKHCLSFLGLILILLAGSMLLSAENEKSYRLHTSNRSPRILADGVPVAPRIFYGGFGASLHDISEEGKEYLFDFTASEDTQSGIFQISPGYETGETQFDNLAITEKGTGNIVLPVQDFEDAKKFAAQWRIPSGVAANMSVQLEKGKGSDGSGALVISFPNASESTWKGYGISYARPLNLKKGTQYRLTFWARALPANNCKFLINSPEGIVVGAPGGDPFEKQIQYAKNADVHFIKAGIAMPWPRPGQQPNWKSVDAKLQYLRAKSANTQLIVEFNVDPPIWWLDQNPSEELLYQGVRTSNHRHSKRNATPSSNLFRKELNEHVRNFVEYIEQHYGNLVAAYHITGHNTGEWFYQGSHLGGHPGYAPADLIAWRKWLQQRYSTTSALQQAWKTSDWTLETVPCPPQELQDEGHNKLFLDRAENPLFQMLIDHNEFLQDMMAETITGIGKTIKDVTHNKKLTVVMYGYNFELSAYANGPSVSGHFGLKKVLQSPSIDILAAPISYSDRQKGGSLPMMSTVESVALAGKMWLSEDDTRTWLAQDRNFPALKSSRVDTKEETLKIHQRNFCAYVVRNLGSWWLDLTRTGWLNDPDIWKNIKDLERFDRESLEHPEPFHPEVSVVLDEMSMLSVPNNKLTASLIFAGRKPLNRISAPYGQYLLDDWLTGAGHGKLNIFLGVWSLTREQREQLIEQTAKSTSIWAPGSGFLDRDQGGDLAHVRELTRFDVKVVPNVSKRIRPTDLGIRLGLKDNANEKERPDYFFAAIDAKPNEILAVYPDGSAAIAVRHLPEGGCSIFCGIPRLTTELIRIAAKKANVHLFTKVDCNVFANRSLLVLHGAQDEEMIEVDTGKPDLIYDALLNKPLGKGPVIKFPLKFGETKILKY